jgi:8-hydroxy-5-deazaflavin:NADPH oxidoreductase
VKFGAITNRIRPPPVRRIGLSVQPQQLQASVASLLRDLDLDPVDAGPLTCARIIEPAGMLMVRLAYGMGLGPNVGMKLLKE